MHFFLADTVDQENVQCVTEADETEIDQEIVRYANVVLLAKNCVTCVDM